ncbi:hypothetical protein NC651_024757 [Populus alba x Populus x berolinensis]|nr:hypothetical protein NC651_024757 [Populus alba x Populus x berolinensis]
MYKVLFFEQLQKIYKTHDDIETEYLDGSIEDFIKTMQKREEEASSGKLDGHGHDFFGQLLKAYQDEDKSKKISINDLIDH